MKKRIRLTDALSGQYPGGQGDFAVRFFLAALVVFGTAGLLTLWLIHLSRGKIRTGTHFPPVFWISTFLLAAGSVFLHRCREYVRIERQRPFRRLLVLALIAGTLFVGLQGFGLWWLFQDRIPSEATTGVNGFVFVFVSLHGLHFTVALLFLIFVTLRAFADRYDHEYYWGVTVCTYFWHTLGIVWAGLLFVFFITA